MVSIGNALRRIKDELEVVVRSNWIGEFCRQLNYCWRERRIPPATTVHLLLLQLLAQVSLAGLRHVSKVAVSAQAIGRARIRLPLEVMIRLIEHAGNGLDEGAGELWRGLRLVLVDGMSFLTEDTPELAKTYGKGKNQRGVSRSYPVAYPAQEIAELYERRWQVEVDFRDLKKGLRMTKLVANTLSSSLDRPQFDHFIGGQSEFDVAIYVGVKLQEHHLSGPDTNDAPITIKMRVETERESGRREALIGFQASLMPMALHWRQRCVDKFAARP